MTSNNYYRCRTFGHNWDEIDDPRPSNHAPNIVWKWRVCLECQHCGTRRYDAIDAYGEVAYRYYSYPDDYQYERGGVPTRAEFRVRLLGDRKR